MTTVYQVSRFLSLDFNQLKMRVAAKFGDDYPALPKNYTKKTAQIAGPFTSPISHVVTCDTKTSAVTSLERPVVANIVDSSEYSGMDPLTVEPSSSIASPFSGAIPEEDNFPLPHDGFLEVPLEFSGQALPSRPILAEIYAPRGGILRLFSSDTALIIQAFLQQ